jgi:hypothetical protein
MPPLLKKGGETIVLIFTSDSQKSNKNNKQKILLPTRRNTRFVFDEFELKTQIIGGGGKQPSRPLLVPRKIHPSLKKKGKQ